MPPRLDLASTAGLASGTRPGWSAVRMEGVVGTLQAYGAGGKSQFLVGVPHCPKIHTSPRPRLMTGRFMVCHPTASSQCFPLPIALIGFEFGDFMLRIDIVGHGAAALALCAAVLTARERRRCCHRRSVRGRLDLRVGYRFGRARYGALISHRAVSGYRASH
jgi:hypothetical protein